MALSPNMNVMIKAAEKAGRSLARDFGEVEQLQVSRKGPGDFVTAADIRAEEIIYEELSRARPDHDFLMEERGAVKADGTKGSSNSEYRWIVDPLDGTSNFMHGLPHWNISIALEHKGEIIAGLVFDPVKDETFRAEKGMGAFIRNKRLRVSGRSNFDSAMIACGAPGRSENAALFISEYMAVKNTGANIRRLGAAALDLAYVAAGRVEGFWERGLKQWDVAAASIIVKEAGGMLGDLSGQKDPIVTGNVICANMSLFNDLKKLLADVEKKKNAA
jgi:myo-inositol-1(or 4)-monophosphatase